jgi:hypothetical protein
MPRFMKSVSNLIIPICLLIFLILSCSKEQKSASKIEGEWKITSMSIDGESIFGEEYNDVTYHFFDCRVIKEECKGRLAIKDNDKGKIEREFVYQILNEGKWLRLIFQFSKAYEYFDYEIQEQTKKKIILKSTESGRNVVQKWVKIKKKGLLN